MDRLIGIIKVLRKGEKRLLRHLYAANTNGEDRLRLQLFDLIESGQVKNDKQALKVLGRNHTSSAFAHLKTRLREDILNVLLLQESSKRIAQANRAAAFECRKKLTQAYVLIFRGAFNEGVELLKSAQIIAEKFELVAEIVLMNHLVREVVHLIKDVKQLHQVNNAINDNLEKWKDILRSEELSLAMTMPHLFNEYSGREGGVDMALISELEHLYAKNSSARIGLWYYLAYIEHSTSQGKYAEAIEAGKKFVALVENNASIRSRNDIAGSNQMLGSAYLNTRDFVNATIHFKIADGDFPVLGNNRLMNFEMLYRAQIGSGDFAAANDTVSLALVHPRIKAKAALLPRWIYFQGCLHFLTGDAEGAFQNLIREGYLTKQKDEYNVHFRLLEIVVMMELRDEEWIEFRIQTLRKLLSRDRKLNSLRIKAAIEILSSLLHDNLSYQKLSKKAQTALEVSLDEAEGYVWNPEGAEIVRIDKWAERKLLEGSSKKRTLRD